MIMTLTMMMLRSTGNHDGNSDGDVVSLKVAVAVV